MTPTQLLETVKAAYAAAGDEPIYLPTELAYRFGALASCWPGDPARDSTRVFDNERMPKLFARCEKAIACQVAWELAS